MSLKRGDVVEIHGAKGGSAPFNGLKAIVVNPERDPRQWPHPQWVSVLVLSPEGVSEPDTDLGYFKREWLRELDTTPARIQEPGLFGVVRAKPHERSAYHRHYVRRYDQNNGGYDWVSLDGTSEKVSLRWDQLLDAELIRPGLDD
jgi:hypothetical protein